MTLHIVSFNLYWAINSFEVFMVWLEKQFLVAFGVKEQLVYMWIWFLKTYKELVSVVIWIILFVSDSKHFKIK